ncbi:MAG: fatty acid hydroxylase [Legionellales bacterium]|nr:fatty acid hydroxylase [Legionellales bacterium]
MQKNPLTQQQRAKLFNNPYLEALTKTHPLIPITLFTGFSVGIFGYGYHANQFSLFMGIGLLLVGLFLFSLVEYLAHRFLYHMQAKRAWAQKIVYTFHTVHHEYPRDEVRLAMPPWLSVLLAAGFYGLFRLLFGAWGFAITPGFLIGYAAYLLIHWLVHAYQPPKNRLRFLWLYHNGHHFKDETTAFGVSSPLWDYVFGTLPKR